MEDTRDEKLKQIVKAYEVDDGSTDDTLVLCTKCGTLIDTQYFDGCAVCERLNVVQ